MAMTRRTATQALLPGIGATALRRRTDVEGCPSAPFPLTQQFQSDGVMGAETALFEISPQMSNVPDEWMKARPDFWKLPSMKTSATKPADPGAKPGQ